MSDFLQAISSVSLDHGERPALVERIPEKPLSPPLAQSPINGPEDVLANLKSQPSEQDAQAQLRWLLSNKSADFNIHVPSSRSIGLLRVIIDVTIPDLWSSSQTTQDLLVECLWGYSGINALNSKLSSFADLAATRPASSTASSTIPGNPHLALLQRILSQRPLLNRIWGELRNIDNENQRKLIWKDLVTLLSSGKLISTVARYIDTSGSDLHSWVAAGQQYMPHLASWIMYMGSQFNSDNDFRWEAAAGLLSKSLGLGYSEVLTKSLCAECLQDVPKGPETLRQLVRGLRPLDQKRFLAHVLPAIQQALLQSRQESMTVQQTSALVSILVSGNDVVGRELVSWIRTPRTASTVSRDSRRAVVAVISRNREDLVGILNHSLQVFGEILFIRHAPAIEQEACAEVILLSAGHLKESGFDKLLALARSSTHMNGVSSRLDASSQRAKTLGMCVGMAMSRLTDKDSLKMNFDVEDVKTTYALQLMNLVEARDSVGTLKDLEGIMKTRNGLNKQSSRSSTGKQLSHNPPAKDVLTSIPASSSAQHIGPRIIEIISDDEEDDLIPYAKPDSDPEDEDEDPTLINRDKPRAPVYIRDLMAGLRDDENYDRHKLSLEHAAPLIRRKAQFGKEVSDHAIELSTILIGLQDTFELPAFAQLRLQALIALLLSSPSTLGPFYARQVFEGDYSLSQRGTLLSAIGLSAREMAGHHDSDTLNPSVSDPHPFPSKRLPDKYHALYAPSTTPLSPLAASLTTTILAPLAASATGPAVLKTRNISSRLSAPPRTTKINNTLAATLAESFFLPLAGGFWTHARGGSRVFAASFFLNTYLTTLGVLLHASGPATRSLRALTEEFWAVLLAARRVAKDDGAVLQALLFGLLTVLEVNAEDTRGLASGFGRELVETREWVSEVYGRMAGGDEEGERLRGLAAGVLVKCGEVMEKWERLLVGEMMDV